MSNLRHRRRTASARLMVPAMPLGRRPKRTIATASGSHYPVPREWGASSDSARGPFRGVPTGLALPEPRALARLLDRRRTRREAAFLLPGLREARIRLR